MSNKIIAVFTGNRAEYGLQYPILKAIKEHPDLDYRLIVSGAHLDKNFGETISEIENDGFTIHAEVRIEMEQDAKHSTAQAIGSGIMSMSKILLKLKPDVLVVYADRFEGFAAVIAGTQMNIPTAHVEGGDVTEGGALDDSVRHAMTKLSHLHFTTNQQATNRLLGMGEESWRVKTVGFPAIDLIKKGNYASPGELMQRYQLNLEQPIVLFTQHSITTEFESAVHQISPTLEAMTKLAADGIQIMLTYPNNDVGARYIIDKLVSLKKEDRNNIQLHRSLGRYNYHGLLALSLNPKYRVACVGNSSSGIKETPAFGCPTVNIGTRQMGRLRAENVIDVDYDVEEIILAVHKCINDKDFRLICRKTQNPYGIGDAGIKIANHLATLELNLSKILRKKMALAGKKNKDGWFR